METLAAEKKGDGVFVPYRREKRRFFAGALGVAICLVLLLTTLQSINFGRPVQLLDKASVLSGLEYPLPQSLTLSAPYWGQLELHDYKTLDRLSALTHQLPVADASFPGDGVDRLEGYLSFHDSNKVAISLGGVLRLDGVAYYQKELQDEFLALKAQLYSQFYSPSRLAELLEQAETVTLSSSSRQYTMNSPDKIGLAEAVRSCTLVEERGEAEATVRGRDSRYIIRLYDASMTAVLRISIYSDETAMVYNIFGGQEYLMCMSGELDTFCQQLQQP